MAPTLLSLPVEIRSMIFSYVLSSRRGFVRFFDKVEPHDGDVRRASVHINVLLVCRQLYDEGLPVLYRMNTFCIMFVRLPNAPVYTTRSSPPLNSQWIMAMPSAGLAAITSIEFRLPLPSTIPTMFLDRSYLKLNSIFPRVKQLVLFSDSVVTEYLYRIQFTPDEITVITASYLRLFAFIPKATSISLDISSHEHTTPAMPSTVIDAIQAAFNGYIRNSNNARSPSVARSSSKFVSYRRKWFEQAMDIVDRRIRHYGPMSIEFWIDVINVRMRGMTTTRKRNGKYSGEIWGCEGA